MTSPSIRLNNVDTAWWRMEDPTNLMMITGILTLEDDLTLQEVMDVVSKRLLKYPRFSRKLAMKGIRWHWVEDPTFDLSNHLSEGELPGIGSYHELVEAISERMSMPLDYERPLWHFHLVHNYEGRSALICRVHHCIGDGIGLMRLLLSLTDDTPDPGASNAKIAEERAKKAHMTVTSGASKALNDEHHEGTHSHGIYEAMRSIGKVFLGIFMAIKGIFVIAKVTFMRPDPKTSLKGKLITEKTAAWSKAVSLKQVKEIGKASGGTINDVLLVAMAGAVRRYFEKTEEKSKRWNFRVAVPVNIRPITENIELGNKFGLVFPKMPIDIVDPAKRMHYIQRMMTRFKRSPEAFITWAFLGVMGWAPMFVERLFLWITSTKITGVMTNVPGPRDKIYMSGHALRNLMFWAPLSARAAIGISILSYNKKVLLGITTDKGLIPDPQDIVDEFQVELDYLAEHYGVDREVIGYE